MRFLASAPGRWRGLSARKRRRPLPRLIFPERSKAFSAARLSAALTLVALGPLAIAAAAQKKPQAPAIHVSTHLVRIGVIVRGRNGPVENLTKNDFVVFDRGKRQEISVFSAEATETAVPTAPGKSITRPLGPLPPNTFSDLPQYGTNKPRNVTIVLLDSLNTLAGWLPMGVSGQESTPYWMEDHAFGRAKDHLIAFLKQLKPGDRVAIYGLGDSLHVLCDFTCDREQLLAVVNKYSARSHISSSDAEPSRVKTHAGPMFNADMNADRMAQAARINGERAQRTVEALAAIAAHVADIPGRKNLVWLTANLPFSAEGIARLLDRANIAVYPVDARGLLSRETMASMPPIARAFSMGTPAAVASPEPAGIQTMRDIADDTGGFAFVNRNDLTAAIRKAVEDSAVTYTIGFYIQGRSLDGKFHKLKIKVERKGLTIRYPKGYFAFRDVPATKEANRVNVIAAVHSPIESTLIPLQARFEWVDKPAPHSLSISGTFDLSPFQMKQNGKTREAAITLITAQQDVTGKVVGGSDSEGKLRVTPEQYAQCLKSGVPFHQIVQLKPSAATLRILVEDRRTAKVGSLIIPLSEIKPQKPSAPRHVGAFDRQKPGS